MILMRAISYYKGHWKGWALKIGTFLGPEMATVHKNNNVPARVGLHVQQLINDVRLLFPLTNQEENGDNAPMKKRLFKGQ
jgi:hypothetical protein